MKTLIATLLFATLPATLPAFAQTTQQLNISPTNRSITISATADAESEPDTADINIGFTTYGATLPATYKSGSETSNAIMKALLDAGATRPQIQSESQRVSRLSDYEIKQQKGNNKFSLAQSWKVSVAPDKAAAILDAAITSGANQSGDIVWRMKDASTLDLEAVAKATNRAHAMAAEMAKTMGVTLGKPIYATNSVSNNIIRPMVRSFAMAKVADAPAPLAIESQRVTSTANVDIIYAIE